MSYDSANPRFGSFAAHEKYVEDFDARENAYTIQEPFYIGLLI